MRQRCRSHWMHWNANIQPFVPGRANPHILDKLKVDYYGTPTPLQQVGNVTVPEARVLMIQTMGEQADQGYRESHSCF